MGVNLPYKPMPVSGLTEVVKAAPTMDDDPDYSDGDVFGAKMTLTDAVRFYEGTAILASICLKSEDDMSAEDVDVLIFDSDPSNTTFTDNGALALDDADLPKLLACVTLDTKFSVDSASCVLQATNLNIPVKASGGTSLYAVMVARATIALAVTDGISVSFGFLQD